MHTQCPECNTVFRITAEQLNAAGGRVRCGECHAVFNAAQHLFDQAPGPTRQQASRKSNPPPVFEPEIVSPSRPVIAEPSPAAADIDVVTADLDALLAADSETTTASAVTTQDVSADLDTLLASDAATPVTEPVAAEHIASDLDALLASEDASADLIPPPSAEPAVSMAEELDALRAGEEEHASAAVAGAEEAESPAPPPSPVSEFDIDLTEFFAPQPDELLRAEAEDQLGAATDNLAEEFLADNGAATASTEPEPEPPPPSMTADLFGEEQIESLLNPQDAETLDLPWERAEEQPAVVVDLSEGGGLPDEFADLGLDKTGNEVDDFDLSASELTSAQPLQTSPPPPAAVDMPHLLLGEHRAPGHSLAKGLAWTLGIVLLLGLLLAQYGYLNREPLVLRYPQLRPAVELACHYTGCRLPPQRDLTAISLLERDVRSHDTYQGALVITATLLNRADFSQPYPDVEVIMRDLGGNIVAARRFRPNQYLSGEHPAQFAPQATAQLLLEVTDPGAAAVGFEFNFY